MASIFPTNDQLMYLAGNSLGRVGNFKVSPVFSTSVFILQSFRFCGLIPEVKYVNLLVTHPEKVSKQRDLEVSISCPGVLVLPWFF